jgi:hypothetical protein
MDDEKIGDRLQIAQKNTSLFGRFNGANLVPVTDFHGGLAISRQKLTTKTRDIMGR